MLADVQGVQAGPGQGQVNTGIGGTKIIALIIQGPAPPGAAMPRGPGGPPGGPGGPGSPLPGPGGSTPHGGFVPGPQYSRMPGAVFDRFRIGQRKFFFPLKMLSRWRRNGRPWWFWPRRRPAESAGSVGLLGEDHQQHRGRDGGDGAGGRDGHDEQIKKYQINKTEFERCLSLF